ncbi:MOSC domain-containing protein [Streptomyces sp. Je 1-369]|uniref:MOSC domain-containing protein n=1 Tax=Streptomyces sp. Je 1-369 TaxID=2966192 RepID=UPI002285CBE1|nr:MOSC domain-containing protein [Streptomyces sp. Je 1-369]WAL93652.1 MOSC domain-containing protein [Streptomyces sp. Je 1-369]
MEKQNRQASGPATENDPTSQSYNWAITPPRRQRKAGGQILSINSGKCVDAEWTQRRGRTAIEKRALTSSCTVTELGIQGDEQAADFHGGRLQAVYAYAREDLDWWSDELGRPLRNGMFGENLDLTGFDVSGAALGERWQAGEVLLEVMAPRMACGTFGAWMGETGWAKRFNDARRPGAYLRVVREGKLSVDDSVHMVWQPQQRVTVAESVGAILGDHEVLRRIHALAEQVPAWDKTAMMFHVSNRTNAKAKGSGETLTSVPPGAG